MHVYPKPGLNVFDPHLKDFLPAEGRAVPPNGFWHRLIQDGDVSLTDPRQAAAPAPATAGDAHQE